jgi:hypothetical protein
MVDWAILDTLIPILSGSGLVALLTFYANKWIKKREEEVEMSKIKMKVILEVFPIFGQLGVSYSKFANELKKNKERISPNDNLDVGFSFFYLCKILFLRKYVFNKIGGFILDDLDGEEIIFSFGERLTKSMENVFDEAEISLMSDLIDIDISYHKFRETLVVDSHSKLYDKFRNWILNKPKLEVDDVIKKSIWLYELIFFEMNSVFYKWYEKRPDFYNLSNSLRTFLLKGHLEDLEYTEADDEMKKVMRARYTNYYNKILKVKPKMED